MGKTAGAPFDFQFCTYSATGALTDADSPPTGKVVRNAVDDSSPTVTVTHISTGEYKATGNYPTTYIPGDRVQVRINFAVSSVATSTYLHDGALDADLGVLFKVDGGQAITTTGCRLITILGGAAPVFTSYYASPTAAQEICFIGAAANKGVKRVILTQNSSGDITFAALPTVPLANDPLVVV